MRPRSILCCLTGLLHAATAQAEELGALSLEVASAATRGQVRTLSTWTTVPLYEPENERVALWLEPWSSQQSWTFDDGDALSLYTLGAALTAYVELGERWALVVTPDLALAGDLTGVGAGHLQGGATVTALYALSVPVLLMAGATGGYAPDGLWGLPVLGADISLGPQDRFTLLFPFELGYHHRRGPWALHAEAITEGTAYPVQRERSVVVDYEDMLLPGYVTLRGRVQRELVGPLVLGLHLGVHTLRAVEHRGADHQVLSGSSLQRGRLGPMSSGGVELLVRLPDAP